MTGELDTYSSNFLSRLRSKLDSAQTDGKTKQSVEDDNDRTAPDPVLIGAAVRHVFTPQMFGTKTGVSALRHLTRDSVPAPGFWESRGRILSRAVRVRTLNTLGLGGIRDAIAQLNDVIDTPSQRMFEALINEAVIELPSLSRSDLVALREVRSWVEGVIAPPHSADDIDLAIARSDAWSPFSHLLEQSFVGRDKNISDLSRFIGLRQQSDGKIEHVRPPRQRLLFMEGVGGIGKSALIAHFLAQFRDENAVPIYPFAYLACDDPSFDVTDAQLMLAAAAEQIKRQINLSHGEVDEATYMEFTEASVQLDIASRLQNSTLEAASKRSSSAVSLDKRLDGIRDSGTDLIEAFSRFADAASWSLAGSISQSPTCLIVIDTFEEIRYRSEAKLLPFWRMIRELLDSSDNIRIIIAGRPPLPRPSKVLEATVLPLEELSPEASVDLLAREAQKTNFPETTLDRLARQIGGNPLNLRLAARVISDETPGRYGIEGIQTRRWGFFRLSEELIRGQLYRRVLDHIHDPRVRALAHPGMVLRRITPQIIETVLAPVCDMVMDEPETAVHLFQELSKEHTLIRREDDLSLRYREDVRGSVLELLSTDQPELTRRVHEAAFHHYRSALNTTAKPDPVVAAEAIYHGLMLGVEGDALDPLWTPLASEHLNSAIDELPAEGKVWLAGKMDISLPEAFYQEASTAEWERMVGPRALSLLQSAGSAEVLSMLSEREERSPQSPLISIEARCWMSIGDFEAAEALLHEALENAPVNGNPGRKAEYLWLLAKVYWHMNDRTQARGVLRELADLASTLTSSIPLVQTLSMILALGSETEAAPEMDFFRADLTKALMNCSDDDISREPDVIRRGFAHVDIASTSQLVRIAVASLSGLYDIAVRRDGFEPTKHLIFNVLQLAEKAEVGSRIELKEMARALQSALDTKQLTSARFLQAFDALRRPLVAASDGVQGPAGALAAQAVWYFTQMETSSLATATLAGIDDYRQPWELETSVRAAAI